MTMDDAEMHMMQHSKQSKLNKLLKTQDDLLQTIMSQRNKIYEDLLLLKQKEINASRKYKCNRIFCKINFSKYKWTFSHSVELFKRLKTLNSEKYMFTRSQYYCFACNNKSDESSTVKNHPEADHMPSTTYTCEHCHDILGNIIDLKCHIDSIHNKNDRSQQAGRFHFEENRKFDSTVSYQCQHCEKRYARPNDLECHISTCHIKSLEESSGEYECDLCDAEFACKSYLISHNEAYHSAN